MGETCRDESSESAVDAPFLGSQKACRTDCSACYADVEKVCWQCGLPNHSSEHCSSLFREWVSVSLIHLMEEDVVREALDWKLNRNNSRCTSWLLPKPGTIARISPF